MFPDFRFPSPFKHLRARPRTRPIYTWGTENPQVSETKFARGDASDARPIPIFAPGKWKLLVTCASFVTEIARLER
jgi:hypothetical protein